MLEMVVCCFQVRGILSCVKAITEPDVHTDFPPEPLDTTDVFVSTQPPTESMYFSITENAPRTSDKPTLGSLLCRSQADLDLGREQAVTTSQKISRQISLEAATSKLVQVQFRIHEVLLQLSSQSECE